MPITSSSIVEELIKDYFGRDIYRTDGAGYKSPQALMKEQNLSPEAAIDKAIENNRVRCLDEKNFLDCDDERIREQALTIYLSVLNETIDNVKLASMEAIIRSLRRDAEVNERVRLMRSLNPSAETNDIEQEAQHKVAEGDPVNLKAEIESMQQILQLQETIDNPLGSNFSP